jgi:hypothetical protein
LKRWGNILKQKLDFDVEKRNRRRKMFLFWRQMKIKLENKKRKRMKKFMENKVEFKEFWNSSLEMIRSKMIKDIQETIKAREEKAIKSRRKRIRRKWKKLLKSSERSVTVKMKRKLNWKVNWASFLNLVKNKGEYMKENIIMSFTSIKKVVE